MNQNFFLTSTFLSPWIDAFPFEGKQVVTCFIQRGDRVLMLQRGRKDAQYKLWGIPGGKREGDETLLEALCRELKEEIGVAFTEEQVIYLASAISKTSTDGIYGLHLYHAKFPDGLSEPKIDLAEHLAYQWVTLKEFKQVQLLHAQKEAFIYVEGILTNIINQRL